MSRLLTICYHKCGGRVWLRALLSPGLRVVLPAIIAGDMKMFLAQVDAPEKYVRVAAAYVFDNSQKS